MADGAADEITHYCVCRRVEDSGIMIECIRGTGGCNGWVHPHCCDLILTPDELEAIDSYVCPLCETPADDFTKMKGTLNTKLANKLALKMRQKKKEKDEPSTSKWSCKTCGYKENDKAVKNCEKCAASRKKLESSKDKKEASKERKESSSKDKSKESKVKSTDKSKEKSKDKSKEKTSSRDKKESKDKQPAKKKSKHSHKDAKSSKLDPLDGDQDLLDDDEEEAARRRRSGREASKTRKNYRVPNSDDDLSDSLMDEDEIARKRLQNKKKRKRLDENPETAGLNSENDDDDEAEFIASGIVGAGSGSSGSGNNGSQAAAAVGPTMVIDKIMSSRHRELPVDGSASSHGLTAKPVPEYFIKWKGFSYLHCSWETRETLLAIDMNNKQRIKRFHEKHGHGHLHHQHHHHHKTQEMDADLNASELEIFNPEYLEVHRILAHRQDPVPPVPEATDPEATEPVVDDGRRFLVKWRVLPYTDATWERACDLKDDDAIAKYDARRVVPPKDEWDALPRPTLRDYRKLDKSPLFGVDHTLSLRAYQLEGLNWLLWNYYNERPSILADEMGLGKTIQTLAFLDSMRTNDKIKARGPFLVVAPLSLIAQWQSECETWTTMNCVVYHGNTEARELIREFEFYFLDSHNRPDKKKPFKFNILVTTYEVAIKDISVLSKIKWRCLVVDEAHRLKNQASRLVEQMRSLRRDHCVLLTGTPLQNKTEELWALLNFLDAKSFPSVSDFLDKFGDLHEAQQVVDLHKMLKPYLLRRQKEDVEKSLPPKEETIIEVELTPVQKQWYRAIYERNTSFLSRGGNPNNVPNLMNVMMELRKCCNHPYLNNGVEERLNDGLVNDAQRHEMMVKCCGKMVLIDKLLPRLKEGGHKVLIFSQMVRVLDIIEDYLRYMGYLHERLDGNIRGNDRQAAVDRFVKPEYNRFVMLLSTKAGGLGLNLTAADTVIIFDSDWNPQNDLQAQARAHRIGQTHSVKIYRLITSKTYEMHMFHKASLKLGLDKAVLTHMRREQEHEQELEAAGGGQKPKKASNKAQEAKEIDELLKRGAYDVFRDDDKAGEQFCEADIDQILQRSSQIVQYEQNAQSSFSKASFVSATTSDDVDIDDPDFWKKAVGLTEPDVADEEELPLQRKRTRVSRFGAHGAGGGAAGAGAGGAGGAGGLGSESESEDELDKKDRENERKERERDEKEKEKADEKKEPRDWTQNGRDRLQRALMHYGFGRWEIIRSQSGGSRTVDEVEQFAREFIYACGLSCAETSGAASSRDDSPFVKAMIRASVYAHKQSLVDEVEMSPVLQDDDFVLKLKQGGGRRVLIRLDMLWRLRRLVAAALDELDQEYWAMYPDEEMKSGDGDGEDATTTKRPPPPPSTSVEFDDRVAYYGVDAVKNKLELAAMGGAERPLWTQITNWWNDEADRSLLIGVFLHGYGRCAQILGDNRLRFQEISEAYDATVLADPNSSHTDAASADDAMSDERTTVAETVVAKPEPVAAAAKSETPSTDASAGAATSADGTTAVADDKKFKQPEVQAMNRLLFWLLSADDVKRQKELELFKKERASVEQQRQASLERKLRAASLRRVELKAMQLAQLDLLRHCQCVVRNAQQMPEPVIGSKIKPKDWTKEERRTFAYLVALHGAPRIDAKASISIDTPRRRAASGQEHLTVPPFAWETDSLSWMQIVTLGKLNKTTQSAKAFYVDRFLPKCQEIAAMKVDPLGTDQRALALADLVGIEFVDAHEGVLAHGLKARNMAWVTLRRTQLLADIGDILTHRKSELLELLRSGSPDLVDKMPVWWCPWVHDLGVFYGMARHGVYAWESILLDRQLPFHRRARENHIRQVFLHGTEAFEALYKHRFATEDHANAWLHKVVDEFPSLALLEQKVHAICVLLNSRTSGSQVGKDIGASSSSFDLSRLEEFTFPPPGNAFECEIMARVRTQDVVLANPFVELTSASVAQELASFVEASKERRDAYLRHLIGGSNGHHNGHHHGDVEMQDDGDQASSAHQQLPPVPSPQPQSPVPQESKPRHSQIPIHMLVS